MKRKMSLWSIVMCLLCLVVVLATASTLGCKPTPTPPVEKIHMIASFDVPPTGPDAEALIDLLNTWKEATGGVLEYDAHWSGELYNDVDGVQATSTGAIQMAGGAGYCFEGFEPRYAIFNAPLLFDNIDHCTRFADTTEWLGPTSSALAKNHLKLLPTVSIFPLRWAGSFPFTDVSDLKGKEFRVMASPTLVRAVELCGAKPVQVASAELAVAMQTGMMDCLTMGSDVGFMDMFQYHRYFPYAIMEPGFVTMTADYVVNLDWWNSIPKDLRDKMEAALPAWAERSRKVLKQANEDEAYAYMKKNFKEAIILSPEKAAEWRAVVKPIYDELAAEIGQDLFNAIERTRAK